MGEMDGVDETQADIIDSAGLKECPNKHSVDYVIRSSIAGGIAGCVVRIGPLLLL